MFLQLDNISVPPAHIQNVGQADNTSRNFGWLYSENLGSIRHNFLKFTFNDCDCTAIIGMSSPNTPHETQIVPLERLQLVPRDYGFGSKNVPLDSTEQLIADMQSVLQGTPSELMQTALWNGGFYLWRSGICADMRSGIAKAEELFSNGEVAQKLREIAQVVSSASPQKTMQPV